MVLSTSVKTKENTCGIKSLFFRWKNVLKEVQIGNAPSLYSVLPCITYLRNEMINGAKMEKGGKNTIWILSFSSELLS
jgi:hypothetical protein